MDTQPEWRDHDSACHRFVMRGEEAALTPPVGYSGKPLAAKLGVKPGMTITVIDAPLDYRPLLEPLPSGVRIATRLTRARTALDFIHCFAARRSVLARRFPSLERALAPAGMLWVSWPKAASQVPTDLTETVVREIGLAQGLVDVKVCAVDATWSGLKFVRRVKDRR
jgi:hypothetical protein